MAAFVLMIGLCLTSTQDRFGEGPFGRALDVHRGGHREEAEPRARQRPLTVAGWARLDGKDGYNILVAAEPKASGTHWEMFTRPGAGTLSAYLPGHAPDHVHSSVDLCDDRWHHLALVLEAARARLIVDGEVVADVALARNERAPMDGGIGLGCQADGSMGCQGWLDDWRLSATARTFDGPPEQATVEDEWTLRRWTFEESEAESLRKWTPGGDTNERALPYPHRVSDFEWERDEHWVDGRWQDTDKGPFFSHSTVLPQRPVGPKSTVVWLDAEKSAALMFDVEKCAVVAGVMPAELRIDPARFGILKKPTLGGDRVFWVPPPKTWRRREKDGTLRPLAAAERQYRGLYLQGHQVLLRSSVGGREVSEHARRVDLVADPASAEAFETPGNGSACIERIVEVDGSRGSLLATVAALPVPPSLVRDAGGTFVVAQDGGEVFAVALVESSDGVRLLVEGKDACVEFADRASCRARWRVWTGPAAEWPGVRRAMVDERRGPSLAELRQPGPRRWGAPIVVRGRLAADTNVPYVVDTIPLPEDNPFGALMFLGGFDFFDDGSAAVCSVHGDVWIVRGLDADLDEVSWQRYATGLYQPLGLKVVDDQVIVLGRDQLTRLHDLDDDGEADFYECFNDDLVITGQDHAYAMHLRTDAAGNFYFLKSGGTAPHGAALLRVAADGSRLDVVARGFRHPYGLGMGPNDELTAADNEGGWVPSSKIDLIEEGGFYGFRGTRNLPPDVEHHDGPLCYLPKVADNSCGGQVWVPDDRWGGYHLGQMLHLSWGRCTVHAVLRQQVGEVWQAATVRIPGVQFESGCAVGQFHPLDGQLYAVGLDGWQTAATRDGCFQRVRATGRPVHLPEAFAAHEDGLRLRFHHPLDRASVEDLTHWKLEQWNYRWTATYGSYHWSVEDPERVGHDPVSVRAARLGEDGRTVFLRIEGLTPVHQLGVSMSDLRAADGTRIDVDLYATIHALAAAKDATR